jgi:hypothetical protein
MIFWPFCAFIWFKNIEKMLLQMTSGFLQLESTLQPKLWEPTACGKWGVTTAPDLLEGRSGTFR